MNRRTALSWLVAVVALGTMAAWTFAMPSVIGWMTILFGTPPGGDMLSAIGVGVIWILGLCLPAVVAYVVLGELSPVDLADPTELHERLAQLLDRLSAEVPRLGSTPEGQRAARVFERGRRHYEEGMIALDDAEQRPAGRRARARLAWAIKEFQFARRDLLAVSAVVDGVSPAPTSTVDRMSLGIASAVNRASPRVALVVNRVSPRVASAIDQIGPRIASAVNRLSPGGSSISSTSSTGLRPTFRESCFFCSRPLAPSARLGAIVTLGGRHREVTACEPHVMATQAGQPPLIKAMDRDGVATPWFAIPGYEPYRDYSPTYALGLAAAALPREFLPAALALAYPLLQRPDEWYADDTWDRSYRSSYWDSHDRWEQEGGWDTHGAEPPPPAAPETPLAMRTAPETSFGDQPTAAETAFAAGFARTPPEPSTSGRSEMDLGSGRDRS